MTLLRWFVLSVSLSTCLSGCIRAGFEAHPTDARTDSGPVVTDGRSDILNDLHSDVSGADAWTPPTLTCQPPALVGTGQPKGLDEPALRLDRTTLVADYAGTYRTQRAGPTAPFGAWEPTTLKVEDGAFIDHAGGEWLVRTLQAATPRRLEVCGPLVGASVTACKPLSIIDTRNNQAVTFDVDGPSMVRTATGLLMSVSYNVAVAPPSFPRGRAIWLLQPTKPSALDVWQGAPLYEVSAPTVVDDAALLVAKDGTIIIVYSHNPSNKSTDDLWFTTLGPGGVFAPGEKLSALNSAHQDAAPELNATPSGVEVFFHSDHSGGARQIYRSECQLQAP